MSSAYFQPETGFAAAGSKPHPLALRSVRSLRRPFLKNLPGRASGQGREPRRHRRAVKTAWNETTTQAIREMSLQEN